MKTDVITLDAGSAGSLDLNDDVFGVEPRADILHRVVRWQRAKKQAGTHKTKSRGETATATAAWRSSARAAPPRVRSCAVMLTTFPRRCASSASRWLFRPRRRRANWW